MVCSTEDRSLHATDKSVKANIGTTGVAVSGNGNTVNTNTINITCTPEQATQILSFSETNLDAVVQLVLQNPARFQLALESGVLHQELTRVTHFGSLEENKNIVSLQEKGTNMRVMENGKKVFMRKNEGLGMIISNNQRIANDQALHPYLKATKSNPLFTVTKKHRADIANVVLSRGEYVARKPFENKLPPSTVLVYDSGSATFLEGYGRALLTYDNTQELHAIAHYVLCACTKDLIFSGSTWFGRLGPGWHLVDSPVDKVIDNIGSLTDKLRRTLDGREHEWEARTLLDAMRRLNAYALASQIVRDPKAYDTDNEYLHTADLLLTTKCMYEAS
jgi:hypothetical protein